MPYYEYECLNCQAEFEVEQSILDKIEATCPSCNLLTQKRLISKTFFTLKGDGWAADNYSSQKK